FFFSSRRRHTRFDCDWSSDVCSSDLHNSSNLGIKQKLLTKSTTSFDPKNRSKNVNFFNLLIIGNFVILEGLWPSVSPALAPKARSEERRVGKECRYRCAQYD